MNVRGVILKLCVLVKMALVVIALGKPANILDVALIHTNSQSNQ